MESADVRGIARTLLSFMQPSVLHGFQARIHELVEKMATLIRHAPALSQEAIDFRDVVMQCFVPALVCRRRRKVELLCRSLCNGDWRDHSQIVHFCSGTECCRDRPHLVDKLQNALVDVMKPLQIRIMNRANWSSWSQSWNFVGLFTALHGLLPKSVALGLKVQFDLKGRDDEDDEHMTLFMVQAAENLKMMQEWFFSETALEGILRVARGFESSDQLDAQVVGIWRSGDTSQSLLHTNGRQDQAASASGACDFSIAGSLLQRHLEAA